MAVNRSALSSQSNRAGYRVIGSANRTWIGSVVAGAVEWARRSGTAPGGRPWNIVTVLTDTGLRYLSKLYNPVWLAAQGLATGS